MSLRCWRYSPSALPRFHSFVLYAFGNHQPLHSFPTRRSSDLDVGVVKDLATHDLDLTAWVSQSPYAQVAATSTRRSGREDEDMVSVAGCLADGTITNHMVNWLSPFKERMTVVTGQDGALEIGRAHV